MSVRDRLSLADVSTGSRWLVDLMVVLALWMDASQPVFGAATAMVWCIVTPYGNPRLLAYRTFGLTIVRYVRDYVLVALVRSVALVLVGGLIGVLVRRGIAGWSLPPFLGSSSAESVTPFIVTCWSWRLPALCSGSVLTHLRGRGRCFCGSIRGSVALICSTATIMQNRHL
ncbi:hypothetical protein [Corynebacterium kroppenstedtii]|uniref:Uncharacterized protein n=1 Tax=Corynebacterium kroppenstedtii TaxID=161879 RepID=A0A2W5V2T5_9CORY|nr:hypothetical protein [Corynebacterium kroppenstedtii]MDU7286510.1 hypothetical protein [Corynebacterium kroppenstedtii]PZR04261.1 MAG: hypothetical protein DI525_07630 [Corynebacterium kroppenstedtii]